MQIYLYCEKPIKTRSEDLGRILKNYWWLEEDNKKNFICFF